MSSTSFFKDRSDLRLSARFIFQQMMMMNQNKEHHHHQLTSLISLKHSLLALFGDGDQQQQNNNDSLRLFKKKHILEILNEEALKLYDTTSTANFVDQKQQNNLSFPVDEALFVKIAERIFLKLLQQEDEKKEQHAGEKLLKESSSSSSSSSSFCTSTVGECFVNELLKTERKLQETKKNNNLTSQQHILINCISQETFLICSSSNPSISTLMPSAETALTLWRNLLDCENILRNQQHKNDSSSSFIKSRCPFHSSSTSGKNSSETNGNDDNNDAPTSNKQKHVSFPFLKVDGNQKQQQNTEDDDATCQCVSKNTILRCFNLGERL